MAAASLSTSLLLLSLLSLLAAGAAARPCKTLLISYTISELPQISAAGGDHAPFRFLAFERVIRLYPDPSSFSPSSAAAATEPLATTLRLPAGIHRPVLPHPAAERAEPSPSASSLRERARNILVVVAGLLFGVGCGALTSATMYLAWYLFSNRDEACGARGYGYDVDDVESPKKRGYVDLPAAPATPVSPLKEGHEGI